MEEDCNKVMRILIVTIIHDKTEEHEQGYTMPRELIYLWLIALPTLGGLAYIWYRVRQSRMTGEPVQWRPEFGRWAQMFWHKWQNLLSRTDDDARSPLVTDSGFPVASLQWTVVAVLVSGGLLVLLGQAAYRTVPLPQRWGVFALMVLGISLFLGAGYVARQQQLPDWLLRPTAHIARFLHIAPGQVPLLLFAFCFAVMASLAAGPAQVARYALVANAAWLTAIVLVVAGSLQPEESWSFRFDRRDMAIMVGLLVGAFLLRGLYMDRVPTTLSGDEGSSGITAVNFLQGQIDNLFSFGWFSFPSFYFAVQSLGIWLLGNTTTALRLTSALAGSFTVAAVYLLARSMFNRPTAVLAALYLMGSHYHIHMSRIGLNNIWDGLFATVAISGLWHGWRYNRRTSFLVSGLALGLGQYFYVSIRVLPLLFLLWAGLALIWKPAMFRQRFAGLVLSAYVALIVFFPLGTLFAAHPDDFNAPMQRVTIFNGWLQNEELLTGNSSVTVISGQILKAALGFTHQPLRLLYDPGVPLLLTWAATLFLLGLVWALLHFDLRYLLLILPLVAAVVASGFSLDPPGSQRYVMSIPLVSIIMAVPLGQVIGWLRRLWPARQRIIFICVLALMVWVTLVDIHYYFFGVYDHYVLGGWNTETATEIAYYLREQAVKPQQIYFFGAPRMGYYSLSTIPYLVPDMFAEDVLEPLTHPPTFQLSIPTLFIFLPERLNELAQVRVTFPDGTYREFWDHQHRHIFSVYEVVP